MGLSGTTNEEKIWNYLVGKGLSEAGAAGMMGNLYAESGLNPQNLQNTYEKKLGYTDAAYTAAVDSGKYQNFVKDSAGYGLAQWTFWSRKQNLLAFAREKGRSIGDLEMQLDFLFKELSEGYKAVLSVLKTASDVRTASNSVLLNFERPANQDSSVQAKRTSYGQSYYEKYAEGRKDDSTMAVKITTAKQLAEKVTDIAKNYKTLYVMGCFGAPMTEANKARYIQHHEYNRDPVRAAMIRAATADTFGFDCVCLIKGALWGWNGDKSDIYGGAEYAVNGVPDIGADTMITKCREVSTGGWGSMEIGEALWCSGHIGVYIGNGLGVECTPSWANRVQITAVANIGSKSGYNARRWTKHGKLPYVAYTGTGENKPSGGTSVQPGNAVGNLRIGDIVTFTGSKHFTSSNAAAGFDCKPGKAKITALANGAKHPYHLVKEAGGGSTVYGWVDVADIKVNAAITKGAKVKVRSGAKTYNGGSLASFVYSNTYTVIQVDKDRVVIGQNGAVTAAVKATDLILL